ncbi:tRNA (adenosine(37)-N6)-threonylcarbamoyltransferase complex ATPase subunit type 1 TsaE [Endozoicomonas sp. G2_1]|uniref:tRNA (adenosine(37)-N6)-threonylcarbamoyltransferase complex ATPase subunit type 1 TsaE n=1 Tax=Endozoicomonas sp. G2_1 TaxID=2821091 RepID=UPI001ADA94D4|nr:tRNA (adenosine(37)-N6)-threonylcarbamoyltransferase complex ATPase subunit type 1 TsaE [Endozoicomonas sp. G2_1]MBO9491585.1 tRNA (adenosine(37)-N6)-threonylcarbamoyltransferase complex ATPase subunit type 1 TsaE [Endozoicomonas sp. G2_1]
MKQLNQILADEQATVAFGNTLADAVKNQLNQGIVVYLNGDLGAGKTTLTRGFVQAMGHTGNVKSPTYTLVEPYELGDWQVYHFDLYRLADPEELEFMGIRDYFAEQSCAFIEWPEKGQGLLANPDITINMAYKDEQRELSLIAHSDLGEQLVTALVNIG